MSPKQTASKPNKAAQDHQAVLDKIAQMPPPYSAMATQLHHAILNAGPKLQARLWYGMPGYATARSKPVVVFFRLDDGTMSFGLSEKAKLAPEPDNLLRPSAWFIDPVDQLDPATIDRVSHLVRHAFD